MKRSIVQFYLRKEELFFGRHYFKIVIIGILVCISVETVGLTIVAAEYKIPILSIIMVMPILLFFCLFFYLTNRPKAKKVCFDNTEETVAIEMLVTDKKMLYQKQNLIFVKINWELSLFFDDGRRVTFSVRKDFIQFLIDTANIEINWGTFGNLYYKKVFGF
jgi:hypothetical protein